MTQTSADSLKTHPEQQQLTAIGHLSLYIFLPDDVFS